MQKACENHFPSINKEAHYPTLESAVRADTPTLPMFDNMYGEGASIKWLQVQITEMLMFTGLREKMTDYQKVALARQLRQMGVEDCITLAEWMQFFSCFECGRYLMFKGYERPNPQVITDSFKLFFRDLTYYRDKIREEEERKARLKEREEAGQNAVPCPPEIAEKWLKASQGKALEPSKPKQTKPQLYVLTWTADGTKTDPLTTARLGRLIQGRSDDEYIIIKYIEKEDEQQGDGEPGEQYQV